MGTEASAFTRFVTTWFALLLKYFVILFVWVYVHNQLINQSNHSIKLFYSAPKSL